MNNEELQELVLRLLPMWQFRLAKPFKALLHDGISPNLYHCMNIISENGEPMSMGELSSAMHMTKQQMTKMVNRLIELDLGCRIGDELDRRVVRISLSDKAHAYMSDFSAKRTSYYSRLFSAMDENDRSRLESSLTTLCEVFEKMPCVCTEKEETECSKDFPNA